MAQFGSTLKELSNMYAKKQPKQVDSITESAPILEIVPFEEASHGLWNVYENVSDVQGAGFVDMDAPLPTLGASSDLLRVNLSVMGGVIECPEDKAKMSGGKEKYFAKKMPLITKHSGMTTEVAIMYNFFRKFAIDNNLVVNAGGNTNANYSITAVRFESGVTTGLYSPEGFKQGAMLHTMALNGGNLYESQGKHGVAAGTHVYGIRLKGYFGIQIASKRNVRSIVNIDDSNVPTEMMMDDLLADVRADEGNTYLFCHRKCRNKLNKYKGDRLEMRVNEKHFSRSLTHWDDVPFMHSYNLMEGTEQKVTVP